MKFNPTVFERLLFPLNSRVYKQIQDTLDAIEEKHPGSLKRIVAVFEAYASKSDTQTETRRPGKAETASYPSVNVSVLFASTADLKISTLHKSKDYKIVSDYDERAPPLYNGSHLTLGFYQDGILRSFTAPLEYRLR